MFQMSKIDLDTHAIDAALLHRDDRKFDVVEADDFVYTREVLLHLEQEAADRFAVVSLVAQVVIKIEARNLAEVRERGAGLKYPPLLHL